ncbi:MAG: darcynin family protein [Steroidobacteraceae bacterium]
MTSQPASFHSALTVFFLVKTAPEWLGFPFATRLEHARTTLQPILDEFQGRVQLKWYDVEFYTAEATDIWMIEAKDHHSYQLFCEKLRETPFWDRFFLVKSILPGELNAWAKNYEVDALQS